MDDRIKSTLTSLTNYFEEKDHRKEISHYNPQVIHYYNEIIRFKSKLNFIINKSLRSLKKGTHLDISEKARYFYATYRILWESTSIEVIMKELKKKDDSLFVSFLKQLKSFSWKKALEGKSDLEKLSIEESIPSFFINHLLPVMSFQFIKENILKMNFLNKKEDCTIRFNSFLDPERDSMFLDDIDQELKTMNIKYRKDREIPELIHVPIQKKEYLIKSRLYKDGTLIFQDKASATVAKILDPKPREFICDMCAAPGMKTSLIAQYSHNKAIIIAGEFLYNRAIQSRKLLNHLNVSNYSVINTDSIQFPIRFDKKFDKVLLDAPCTGNGTFLSHPELKWRQNDKFLHQNVILQEKLLESALELLKPNGILVYSTCSLYPEEGEFQIEKVFNRLEPLKLPDWISPSYPINGTILPGTGRLFPFSHGTQGFFISKLKKI